MRTELPHPLTGKAFPSPVPPGTGWPDDPGAPDTPVAHSAADVRALADTGDLAELDARVSVCRACPRLVAWREEVAEKKRASFADQPYWGRPIAGWGSPAPSVLVVGLAPAANGGNRTGRVFTGDRSGDWLFASLHRVGLAAQATSVHAGDGQALLGARMVAAVRCAPPANKPTPAERDACEPWIARELQLVAPSVKVVVCLGSFGWSAALKALRGAGYDVPRPLPRFGHAAEVELAGDLGSVTVLGCYHPSQQNTFTGRLTADMLDAVFARAKELSEAAS
jgi:uracil-DNA glycosylase family 4